MPAFALLFRPHVLTVMLQPMTERSPTDLCLRRDPAASVNGLAPIHFRRQTARPVSCYALFKGWLLLSQPPGCPGGLTSFFT